MKPYVICHMLASVDGRIVTSGWNLSSEGPVSYTHLTLPTIYSV